MIELLFNYFMLGLFMIFSFLLARALDPNWRCLKLRQYLKRNYIVLNISDKSNKHLFSKVVDAHDDTAIFGARMWVLEKSKLYTKKFNNKTKLWQKEDYKGFNIETDNIKFEQGAPNIYVDNENITPLEFYENHTNTIKPNEIGSTLQAWVYNQLAKNIKAVNLIQNLLIVLVVIGLLNLAISGLNYLKTEEMQEELGGLKKQLAPTKDAEIEDGKIVIDKTKTTGVIKDDG